MQRLLIFLAIALGISTIVGAEEETSFALSAGYSHIHFPQQSNLPFNRDGGYIDGDFLWRLPTRHVPVLAGVGISGSANYEQQDIPITGSFFDEARLRSDLGFFSIEARAAIPISPPHSRGFFLLPQIGAGLLVNEYSIDTATPSASFTVLNTEEHTGAAFEIRPTLQGGYSWGWGSAGAEVSYMAAWGDFGRFGNRMQEFRAGVFLRLKF